MNIEVKNGKLTITCDVSETAVKNAPISTSGKNKVVDSSHGYTTVPGTSLRLNLNVITK